MFSVFIRNYLCRNISSIFALLQASKSVYFKRNKKKQSVWRRENVLPAATGGFGLESSYKIILFQHNKIACEYLIFHDCLILPFKAYKHINCTCPERSRNKWGCLILERAVNIWSYFYNNLYQLKKGKVNHWLINEMEKQN